MAKPCCFNCVFWRRTHDHNQTPVGKCCVNPPRYDAQQGAVFPITEDIDWCGRHQKPSEDPHELLDSLDVERP